MEPLIAKLTTVSQISASGLFMVNKTLITTLVGTSIGYLIVMLQFKLTFDTMG